MGKCVYNPKWSSSYSWVMKAEDKYKAYCKCCKKLIDLEKMGEGALKSHEKSEKHKLHQRSDSVQFPMEKFVVPPPPSATDSSPVPSTSASVSVSDFATKNDVLKAEVMDSQNSCKS